MILEQNKLHEQASAEQLSQATKTSSIQAAELMEKLEKLTTEASEQLTALKELTKRTIERLQMHATICTDEYKRILRWR